MLHKCIIHCDCGAERVPFSSCLYLEVCNAFWNWCSELIFFCFLRLFCRCFLRGAMKTLGPEAEESWRVRS